MTDALSQASSYPDEFSQGRYSEARFKRVRWWATFSLLSALSFTWSLSTPLFGGPDEQSHSIRAASVARGELVGQTLSNQPEGLLYVQVPQFLESSWEVGCFAFKPDIPADCFELHGSSELVAVPTTAGKHPPAYYLLAGLPLRFVDPPSGLYLMRLVGILVSAALMASAIDSLGSLQAPRTARAGFLLALTPMVLFVSGIVNPSGLEIAAALGLWSSGAVLIVEADRHADVNGRLASRVGISLSVLVLSRALSPLWAGLIVIALLATASRRAVLTLLRSRKIRAWALVAILATAFQVGWLLIVKSLVFQDENAFVGSLLGAMRISIGKAYDMFVQMIGNFGYLDTPSPPITILLWTMGLGAIVSLALTFADRRRAIVLAVVTALVVLVPLALEVYQARYSGFVWQGRYTLPLAVGVPILASVGISQGRLGNYVERSAMVPLILSVFVLCDITALFQQLRRNTVGLNGPLAFWQQPAWSPPIVPLLLIAIHLALLLLLAVVFLKGDSPLSERFADDLDIGGDADHVRDKGGTNADEEEGEKTIPRPHGPDFRR